jgi:hypothetical protein
LRQAFLAIDNPYTARQTRQDKRSRVIREHPPDGLPRLVLATDRNVGDRIAVLVDHTPSDVYEVVAGPLFFCREALPGSASQEEC